VLLVHQELPRTFEAKVSRENASASAEEIEQQLPTTPEQNPTSRFPVVDGKTVVFGTHKMTVTSFIAVYPVFTGSRAEWGYLI
jgi:hypothetical protein